VFIGGSGCGRRWARRLESSAKGLDLGGLDHVALVVAEGVALVGDDGGQVGIGQGGLEGLHGGAGLAVEHAVDVAVGDQLAFGREQRAGDDLAARQGREGRRDALAFGLVAGGAVFLVGGLAGGHQLVLAPGLVAAGRCGGHLGLLPATQAAYSARARPHDHRHEAVVLAAQLGALAAIDAGLLDADPGFAQEAGDRVALDAELGHPPGVDHVGGGEQDAHLAAHRQHHFVVHLQQVVFALGRLALDLLAGRGQGADEADAGVGVFVLPFPLQAGDLEHHVGLGAGVFHLDHRVEGRDAHQHEVDEEQDREGHQHPEPLQRAGWPAEAGRLGADALAVADHRIHHDREHHHEQHGDHHHELVVHRQGVAADGGDGLGEVPGVVGQGGAGTRVRPVPSARREKEAELEALRRLGLSIVKAPPLLFRDDQRACCCGRLSGQMQAGGAAGCHQMRAAALAAGPGKPNAWSGLGARPAGGDGQRLDADRRAARWRRLWSARKRARKKSKSRAGGGLRQPGKCQRKARGQRRTCQRPVGAGRWCAVWACCPLMPFHRLHCGASHGVSSRPCLRLFDADQIVASV
jgi:hypothetical protein